MDKIKKVAQSLGIITVEDMERYTALELIMMVANKVNDQNEKIEYLLSEGLLSEVEQIFSEWTQDGTFDRLINESALQDVNNRLESVRSRTLYMSDIPREEGEQDDTGRIRRAFDMVRTRGYKTIFFNSGDYILTPPTNLSEYGIAIPNNVKLVGEDGAKIKTQSAVAYPALFTLDIGEGAENVCIENIIFDNTEDTHKTFINSDKNACMLLKINNIVGDICIKDCTFTSYSQNTVVSFPFQRSEGKVTFSHNKFYFKRHINEWYDSTLLSIAHKDVEYHDNQFYSINNGTTSWKCSTPFEIHSYKCRAYNNDCEHFEGGCLIVSSSAYLPLDNQLTPDIKVYNNRFRHVNSGIQVWGEVTDYIKEARMKNIEVFENEIILVHDHNYHPLNDNNQLSGYGLSLKVVGNCAGYENINFHNNTLDFKIIGSHDYTGNDCYLQQRGAISCQTNILTRGITFKNNLIKNYPFESIVIGGDIANPYNIEILDNVFTDCSYGENIPLIAFNGCDGVRIRRNKIVCETKNYYDFIRFYNKTNTNISILENEILNITAQGYNLNIKYDDFTSMVNTINTLKYDIKTIDFISKPKKPSIYFQDTYDNLSLNKGDVIFLTSGSIRGKVVTSQFANTKVYDNITCTKQNGDDWLYVNDIKNLEVGDVVLIGTSPTVITCLDWVNMRVRVMFVVADFSGSLPVQGVIGTFADLP